MTGQKLTWTPTKVDQELLKQALVHIASERGIEGFVVAETFLARAQTMIVEDCSIVCREVGGTESADQFGMVIANRKRQLAYSVKISNFLRDPVPSAAATGLMISAAFYAPSVIEKIPPTFPAFLISMTFSILRAFAHPIGFGEVALLHAMYRVSDEDGMVPFEKIKDLGAVLVSDYGYTKGENRNEVEALLKSLIAFSSIEEAPGGIRVKESIPFGVEIVGSGQ